MKPKHKIVENLIKIMNDKGLNKSTFASIVGFPEPKWNKISNGEQGLNINDFSIIAERLNMREIDIITYPEIYVNRNTVSGHTGRFLIVADVPSETRDFIFDVLEKKNDGSRIISNHKLFD